MINAGKPRLHLIGGAHVPAIFSGSAFAQDSATATADNVNTMWPGVPVVPVIEVGSTDGSFSNAMGLPAYGLTGIFHKPGGDGVHEMNERILVQSLYNGHTFLCGVTKDLAK